MFLFRHLFVLGALGLTTAAGAQEPVRPGGPAAPAVPAEQPQPDSTDGTVRFRLPTITVTAQKEVEDIQEAPVSVTAVTADVLEQTGARSVSEASQLAPNTFFSEFTARKLSNPRFRGIGSSPNNPGVTTYIDGYCS
jgi:outer membrane receptor protein involved in Fe transport